MTLTYFLFFSFLSMLSKSENDNPEGKSSYLPFFFSGTNRGKIGGVEWAQIKFASKQSSCSRKSSECPIWTLRWLKK